MQQYAYTQIVYGSPSSSRIVYNPDFSRREGCDDLCMEFIVSGHECTHASGVDDESRADCGGVKLMKKLGRYSAEMKRSVARFTLPAPADYDGHPSGPKRVRDMDTCDRATGGPIETQGQAQVSQPNKKPEAAPIAAPSAGSEACYYAILSCHRSNEAAENAMFDLGTGLTVVNTDRIAGFQSGWYCVSGGPATRESAYSTMSSFSSQAPGAYVKWACN